MVNDSIGPIARKVRELVLYYAYHPDSSSAHWHKHSSMAGMCAISSVFLQSKLLEAGVTGVEVVRGHFRLDNGILSNHTWLEIPEESLVIDITACQFKWNVDLPIPDVLITPRLSFLGLRYVNGKAGTASIRNLFAFWLTDQHPWGRFNGVNHQDWLSKAWSTYPELALAA